MYSIVFPEGKGLLGGSNTLEELKCPGVTPFEWVKIVGASIESLVRMKRPSSIF